MHFKVCGMRQPSNILDLERAGTDFIGFIYASMSPRNIQLSHRFIETVREIKANKVGVFVNAPIEDMRFIIRLLQLNTIQLHGEETNGTVKLMQNLGVKVIKAISVDDFLPEAVSTHTSADYLLFDTKGPKKGGNGVKFNWELLSEYEGETPFFLSGGIQPNNAKEIIDFNHPKCIGIDINSGFEISPGIKDIAAIQTFKKSIYEFTY